MTVADIVQGWAPLCGAAIGGGGIGAGLRPVLDYWKGRRRQTDEVAMGLVERLQARIERLEENSAAERALCDAKLAVLRHELKNVQGNFDALLLAIEVAPEKAAEVVAKIKARRSGPAAAPATQIQAPSRDRASSAPRDLAIGRKRA